MLLQFPRECHGRAMTDNRPNRKNIFHPQLDVRKARAEIEDYPPVRTRHARCQRTESAAVRRWIPRRQSVRMRSGRCERTENGLARPEVASPFLVGSSQ